MEEDCSWEGCDSVGQSLPLSYALCFGKPSRATWKFLLHQGLLRWQKDDPDSLSHTCAPPGRGDEGMPKHQIWAGSIIPGVQLSLASFTVPLRLL